MGKLLRFILRAFTVGIILLVILLAGAGQITRQISREYLFSMETAPDAPVAIIFGAGLRRDGTPTAVLRDRIETAASLYFAGKVQKLLMSGDNRFLDYNEPGAMQAYALELGVPEEDIVLDFAGRRTYDTCYRARHIFNVQQAVLVTQAFHLPRAVYTCTGLGIEAFGVMADQRAYSPRALSYWKMRESAAALMAVWEVSVSRPTPVLGQPEPIFH